MSEEQKRIEERLLALMIRHLRTHHGAKSVTAAMLVDGLGTLSEHNNDYHSPDFEEEGVAAGLISAHAADEDAHHDPVTIGDGSHSLATQVLSAVLATASQVGHVGTGAQSLGGLKTFEASLRAGHSEAAGFVDIYVGTPGDPGAGYYRLYVTSTGQLMLRKWDSSEVMLLHEGSANPVLSGLWEFENLIKLQEKDLTGSPGSGHGLLALETDGKLRFRDEGDTDHELLRDTQFDAKGKLMSASAASAPSMLSVGTNGQVIKADSAETPGLKWVWDEGGVSFIIDGGGSVIATGVKGGFEAPYDLFITGWTITSDDGTSGAIVVDVWADTYANFPPTVADTIAGSEKPTITATGNKGQDLSLTTWTQYVAKGKHVFFNVDSVTALKLVKVALRWDKRRTS